MIASSQRTTCAPTSSRPLALFAVAALAAAVACRPEQSGRPAAPTGHLVGVWDITFRLDRPMLLGQERDPSSPIVAGSMAFINDRAADRSPDLSGETHVGVYNLDFRPTGVELPGVHGFPVVIARALASTGTPAGAAVTTRDSVSMVLDPGSSRFPFRLEGTIAGDSVSGTWMAGQASGGGRFVMHRHRAGSSTPERPLSSLRARPAGPPPPAGHRSSSKPAVSGKGIDAPLLSNGGRSATGG